jgi:hypothetical protein
LFVLGCKLVDSTVQEKGIAHATDSKLLERARQQLVQLAGETGMTLRQSYNRTAPTMAIQVGRYAHAKQYKRMRASLKKLKPVVFTALLCGCGHNLHMILRKLRLFYAVILVWMASLDLAVRPYLTSALSFGNASDGDQHHSSRCLA